MGRSSTWLVVVALSVPILPVAAVADDEVQITGNLVRVTDDWWAQWNPRISGDIVVFTETYQSSENVVYVDLSTGVQTRVTEGGGNQRLQDVQGNRIVYADYGDRFADVRLYDVSSASNAILTDQSGNHDWPRIDGDLVVFQYQVPGQAQSIGAYDLAQSASLVITNNDITEMRPVVSGRLVVFERWPGPGNPASIIAHDLDTGTEWAIASDVGGDQRRAAVSGDIVVFDVRPDGETDRSIAIHDLLLGSTLVLDLDGNQEFAHVSGDIVAFDDRAAGSVTTDIQLLHLPTGHIHQVTSSGSNDYLNHVDGNRLVFTSNAGGSIDIWYYEFEVLGFEQEAPTLPPEDALEVCETPKEGTPLFEATTVRGTGKPQVDTHAFSHPGGGDVIVTVQNTGCGAGWAKLNGEDLFVPDDLDAELTCLWGVRTLSEENVLELSARSKPGCTLTVAFHELPPEETGGDVIVPGDLEGQSCESVSGAAWLAVGLVLLGFLLAGRERRPAPVLLRRRRRP